MATVTLDTEPTTLNIRVYGGDDFAAQFTFVDQVTEAAYPLTGTWEAQIRTAADEIVAEFAVDDSDADTGILRLALTGTQTALLAGLTRLVWDLQQTDTGTVRTWYGGAIHAREDVTRP